MPSRTHALLAAAVAAALLLACKGSDPGATVSGTVVTLAGHPLSGTTVRIVGGTPVTSDAQGDFQIAGVKPPYDLVAVADDGGQPVVTILQGLTTLTPVVALDLAGPPHTATVSAALQDFSSPAGAVTTGLVSSLDVWEQLVPVDPGGAFGAGIAWNGLGVTGPSLFALQWLADSAGRPTAYTGRWGADAVSVLHGETAPTASLGRSAVGSLEVSFAAMNLPAGMAVTEARPSVRLAGLCPFPLPALTSPGNLFSSVLPVFPGDTLFMTWVMENAAGDRVAFSIPISPDQDTSSVLAEPPIVVTAPLAGAPLGPDTPIRWTAPDDAVHAVVLAPASGVGPSVRVLTQGDGATLAHLAAAGVTLPHGASYAWRVESVPLATVDLAATRDGVLLAEASARLRGRLPIYLYLGRTRTFTSIVP